MTTKKIIEQDICATCAHLRPSKPLPTDKCIPPFGVFDIQCDCAKGWPYIGVFVSANARSECPEVTTRDCSTCKHQDNAGSQGQCKSCTQLWRRENGGIWDNWEPLNPAKSPQNPANTEGG